MNDNVPMTLDPVYYAQIVENQSGILPIVQLAASDGDLDPDQRISYKISAGNPESYFNIDIGSGKEKEAVLLVTKVRSFVTREIGRPLTIR